MPRAKTGRAALVVPEVEPEEPKGPPPIFPLVVDSFQGRLPGEFGYDEEKDRMMIGFRFGSTVAPAYLKTDKVSDISPYDFCTNPKTGKRQGQALPPGGSSFTSLKDGVGMYSDLPPLEIWKKGVWLCDLVWEPQFNVEDLPSWIIGKVELALKNWPEEKNKVPESLYPFYVTSGEGTSGNSLYRVFELPPEMCGRKDPHHPIMWPEKWQKGKPNTAWKPSYSSTPSKPSTPALPAGVRMRCPGCGHWFTMSDLPGHNQVCGKGDDADWAIMCHTDCGCRTLDEASKPKKGFPRPVTEKPKDEVVVTDGASKDPPKIDTSSF